MSSYLPKKYAQYGSNEETVRAYQQQIFTTYEEQGYTIGEIVRGFCARGAVTMSFGPESPAGLSLRNGIYPVRCLYELRWHAGR